MKIFYIVISRWNQILVLHIDCDRITRWKWTWSNNDPKIWTRYQGYFLFSGAYPYRGDFHLPRGGKKLKKRYFAAPKAPRNIFEHYFEILKVWALFSIFFGKFVNKNAIKSDFWGVVGWYISKISKKSPFLGKKYIFQLPKILRSIYQSADHPPSKYPC